MMRIILATIALALFISPSWGSEYNFIKEQRIHGEDYVPDWGSIKYTEPNQYKTYEGIPCNFHGAEVSTNNNSATLGDLRKKCCKHCKGYKSKKGQSIHTNRGTPVFAITDMTLVKAENWSLGKYCGKDGQQGITENLTMFGCAKPYDNLRLTFKDNNTGRTILFYHLMSQNPAVRGFGYGECKVLKDREYNLSKFSSKCGGITKSNFKKGDVIGFVGTTGSSNEHNHIALGIYVYGGDPLFEGETGLVVPSNNFEWENYPTDDPMKYLLPIAPN